MPNPAFLASLLLLPGTIPGLLRRGSPIVFLIEEKVGPYIFPVGSRAVVEDVISGEPIVRGKHINPAAVALDLTDATGRAHGAWWLARHPGASWHLDSAGYRRWELHGGERPQISVSRSWEGLGEEARRARGLWAADDCPALDELNPFDPRLLLDGSRWVDAEALRLVVLHHHARKVVGRAA